MPDNLFVEYNAFGVDAPGSSRENFWLKGLPFKITYKFTFAPQAVELYSGIDRELITNKIAITKIDNLTYEYSHIPGEINTATYIADGDYNYGIKFYFRLKVIGTNDYKEQINYIWVREPIHFIYLNQCHYIKGYPILFGHLDEADYALNYLKLPLEIARFCYSSEGVKNYGGAKFFSVKGYENLSNMVIPITRQPIGDINEVHLILRENEEGIANFAVPPGWPDYSKYFTRITFEFYTKIDSAVAKEMEVILFPARSCVTGGVGGGYGYDSSEIEWPNPILYEEFFIHQNPEYPPTYPPPTCGSTTTITIVRTGEPGHPEYTGLSGFNMLEEEEEEEEDDSGFDLQADEVIIEVWSQPNGQGTLLARGTAKPISTTLLPITRKNMEKLDLPEGEIDNLDQPIEGHAIVKENNRTSSNSTEILLYGCNKTPIPEEEIIITEPPDEIKIETPDRELDTENEYKIIFREDKYDSETEIILEIKELSETQIILESAELDGYFKIVENGIEITGWIRIETESGTINYSNINFFLHGGYTDIAESEISTETQQYTSDKPGPPPLLDSFD